jgi:hypothetical protein
VIDNVSLAKPSLHQLADYHHTLVLSGNDTDIEILLEKSNEIYEELGDSATTLYSAFSIVKILCFLNCSFLIQDIVVLIITKRLGRFFEFPTLQQIFDAILFATSVWVFQWIALKIDKDVNSDSDLS